MRGGSPCVQTYGRNVPIYIIICYIIATASWTVCSLRVSSTLMQICQLCPLSDLVQGGPVTCLFGFCLVALLLITLYSYITANLMLNTAHFTASWRPSTYNVIYLYYITINLANISLEIQRSTAATHPQWARFTAGTLLLFGNSDNRDSFLLPRLCELKLWRECGRLNVWD